MPLTIEIGSGMSFTQGSGEGGDGGVPSNTLLDRAGNPILDRSGGYILTR